MENNVFFDSRFMQTDAERMLLAVEVPLKGTITNFETHQALILDRLTKLITESKYQLRERPQELMESLLGQPIAGRTPRDWALSLMQTPAFTRVLTTLQERYQAAQGKQINPDGGRGEDEELESFLETFAGEEQAQLAKEARRTELFFEEATLRTLLEQLAMMGDTGATGDFS